MRKIILCGILLLISNVAKADWVLDATLNRHTNKDAVKVSMTTSQAHIYIAWEENDDSDVQNIYVSRFSSNGLLETLGDGLGTTYTTRSYSPATAYFNNRLYLSFSQFNSSTNLRLLDWNGVWDVSYPMLNTNTGGTYDQYMGIINSQPCVSYASQEIFVHRYNGNDWDQLDGQVNEAGSWALSHHMVIANNTPYVVFLVSSEIYVKYYNGSSWEYLGGKINTETTGTTVSGLQIQVDAGEVYVFYYNLQNQQLIIKNYSNSLWETVSINEITDGVSGYAVYRIFNHEHYLTYSNLSGYLIANKYSGTNWEQLGSPLNVKLPPLKNYVYNGDLVTFNNILYIAWSESDGQYRKMYLKHYIEPTPTPQPTPTPDSFNGDIISEKYIYASPNPVRGSVANIVIITKQPAEISCKLFSPQNKEVLSFRRNFGTGRNVERINMANLANGVYLLLVKAKNAEGKEERVIKKIALVK